MRYTLKQYLIKFLIRFMSPKQVVKTAHKLNLPEREKQMKKDNWIIKI